VLYLYKISDEIIVTVKYQTTHGCIFLNVFREFSNMGGVSTKNSDIDNLAEH